MIETTPRSPSAESISGNYRSREFFRLANIRSSFELLELPDQTRVADVAAGQRVVMEVNFNAASQSRCSA